MMRRNHAGFGILAILVFCAVARADERVLYEKPSPYNTIIVTEDERGLRTLLFEKGGARQSVVKPGDADHLELPYASVMTAGLAAVQRPDRVLIVGLGGGTIPGFLRKHYPRMQIDVVDIDPDVVAVAKQFFGFCEDSAMRAYVDDGRRFIERCRQPYDIIFLDAFTADSVPYRLATREFLQAVRRAVKRDGAVVGNIWTSDLNPLYGSMVRTYQEIFGDLCLIDVPNAGNKILMARPRQQSLDRDALAEQGRRVSKERCFRFDLGKLIAEGFHHPSKADLTVRVLTDQDEPKKRPEVGDQRSQN